MQFLVGRSVCTDIYYDHDQRWRRTQAVLSDFNGCLLAAKRRAKSGESIDDIRNAALTIYRDRNTDEKTKNSKAKEFNLMTVYKIVEDMPKFKELEANRIIKDEHCKKSSKNFNARGTSFGSVTSTMGSRRSSIGSISECLMQMRVPRMHMQVGAMHRIKILILILILI